MCVPPFIFPDSGLYLLDGFDFHFNLFEWRDTENQQLDKKVPVNDFVGTVLSDKKYCCN